MARNRYANKRMHVRGGGGRFKKATMSDFGLGTCEACQSVTVRVYDGDANDPFPHPMEFRQRCFHCEPKTQAELALDAEIAAAQPKQPSIYDLLGISKP